MIKIFITPTTRSKIRFVYTGDDAPPEDRKFLEKMFDLDTLERDLGGNAEPYYDEDKYAALMEAEETDA